MRYPKALTIDQIKFIINNSELSNRELSEKLDISCYIIANYKTRMRKLGLFIPKYSNENTINRVISDLIK